MRITFSACLQFFLEDPRFTKLGAVAKDTHVFNVGNYVSEYISDLKKNWHKQRDASPTSSGKSLY